jgi:hypothetical protein
MSMSLVPAIAAAHPGHGHTDPRSWTHYVTEPVHAAALIAALVALEISIQWQRGRARRRESIRAPRR